MGQFGPWLALPNFQKSVCKRCLVPLCPIRKKRRGIERWRVRIRKCGAHRREPENSGQVFRKHTKHTLSQPTLAAGQFFGNPTNTYYSISCVQVLSKTPTKHSNFRKDTKHPLHNFPFCRRCGLVTTCKTLKQHSTHGLYS